MVTISLREFQLKPSKYVNNLPIGLTRYGRVIAILSFPGKEEAIEEGPSRANMGFCENHYQKGVEYPLKMVSLEDSSGELLWTKRICPHCIKRLEGDIKRYGGKLIYG